MLKMSILNRLLNISSPLVVEGVKSIFNEAVTLCVDNDLHDKYLMTFLKFFIESSIE